MNKYSVDYDQLEKSLTTPKYFKYADVKDRLEKVAFGTVRFMDANEDIDGLWEIQNTDDGEVIIAKYDYDEPGQMKTHSSWDVIPDLKSESMNIFYKGDPVARIPAVSSGAELKGICKNASIRLETDSNFRNMLLEEVGIEEKAQLFSKYPELIGS